MNRRHPLVCVCVTVCDSFLIGLSFIAGLLFMADSHFQNKVSIALKGYRKTFLNHRRSLLFMSATIW